MNVEYCKELKRASRRWRGRSSLFLFTLTFRTQVRSRFRFQAYFYALQSCHTALLKWPSSHRKFCCALCLDEALGALRLLDRSQKTAHFVCIHSCDSLAGHCNYISTLFIWRQRLIRSNRNPRKVFMQTHSTKRELVRRSACLRIDTSTPPDEVRSFVTPRPESHRRRSLCLPLMGGAESFVHACVAGAGKTAGRQQASYVKKLQENPDDHDSLWHCESLLYR